MFANKFSPIMGSSAFPRTEVVFSSNNIRRTDIERLPTMITNKPFTPFIVSSTSMLHYGVLTLIQNYKILNSIIRFIMINMVNYFFRLQISSDRLFHNQSVFKHITLNSERMLRNLYLNISLSGSRSSAFPTPILFHWLSRFGNMFRRVYFTSILMSLCKPFIPLTFQFSRSKFSKMNQFTATTGTFLSYNFFIHNCIIVEVGGINNL